MRQFVRKFAYLDPRFRRRRAEGVKVSVGRATEPDTVLGAVHHRAVVDHLAVVVYERAVGDLPWSKL